MVATSHDVMPDIELYQPADEATALDLAARLGNEGWLLSGGQDTYGWLKDRNKTPSAMIELTQIDAWKGVKETSDGVEIGATTTLTEIANDPLIKSRFGLLAKAASVVASPQIRNVGTLGGNLNQDARCWYYRRGLDCYRAGGNICYADSPEGLNREHALFGASRCVAVSPSDTAPALVALDATMVISSNDLRCNLWSISAVARTSLMCTFWSLGLICNFSSEPRRSQRSNAPPLCTSSTTEGFLD